MKGEKPKQLIEYEMMLEEILKSGPPHFCYNCLNYSEKGKCEVFDMEPPKEFTQYANECSEWIMEPPF